MQAPRSRPLLRLPAGPRRTDPRHHPGHDGHAVRRFEQVYPASEFAFSISGSTSRHLFPTPGFQDWDVRALPRPGPGPAARQKQSPRLPDNGSYQRCAPIASRNIRS